MAGSELVRRALADIESATERRRERDAGVVPFTCRDCNRVLLMYKPPVFFVKLGCKRCGSWNVLTTESAGT